MRGDWKDQAMQYRDIDRAAQAKAEREIDAMTVKHNPACPLEYRADGCTVKYVDHGQWFTVARFNESKFNPESNKQNARYLAHAANAYPRLVVELKRIVADTGAVSAAAILRSLGEDANV